MKISQKQIGRRISEIRKMKGLSQEDLAKIIKVSRPSLAQIELGNRCIDISELQRLSIALGFSMDEIMSENYSVMEDFETKYETNPKKSNERISTPTLQIKKFKNVLLYILERCAGKPNVSDTVLYKLLYFSDFNYYELYEEHLTGAKYRKLPNGPVPQKMDNTINQMIEKGLIQRIKTEYFHKMQTRYIPLVKAELTELKASEKEVIDKVIEQMSDWSAAMISNYSFNDKPWKATDTNKEINYELVFYRRPPYSVRTYQEDEEDTF